MLGWRYQAEVLWLACRLELNILLIDETVAPALQPVILLLTVLFEGAHAVFEAPCARLLLRHDVDFFALL